MCITLGEEEAHFLLDEGGCGVEFRGFMGIFHRVTRITKIVSISGDNRVHPTQQKSWLRLWLETIPFRYCIMEYDIIE